MSDYLWDKTGEPDADVEQLENLLGALKYQPRPLEIPATAMPNVARPVLATPVIFSRPRLAIAASLLLMLLAGAWLVTRQTERETSPIATSGKENAPVVSQPTETPVVAQDERGNNAPVNKSVQPELREEKNVIMHTAAPQSHRPSRQLIVRRQKQTPVRVKQNDSALQPQREELAFTPEEEREATEKVMLALRLASAKLNFAQRELREISRVEK